MKKIGRVVKNISNCYTVDIDGKRFDCIPRGKFRKDKVSPVVGDEVLIDVLDKTIEEIKPRRNYLNRPVVSNVDMALIVTSVKKPDLSLTLLDKLISIVIMQKIEPVICFSKLDLLEKKEIKEIKLLKKYYESIGIKVVVNKNKGRIKRILKNKVVVITGQTGAGKSTLLNQLDPSLNLETKPISEALNRGVHTTRHVELYQIGSFYMVDTPGFSALDFKGITVDDLKSSFKEFGKYQCEFSDCTHQKEKGCKVIQGVNKGDIKRTRYENYLRFLGEVYESNSKLYK